MDVKYFAAGDRMRKVLGFSGCKVQLQWVVVVVHLSFEVNRLCSARNEFVGAFRACQRALYPYKAWHQTYSPCYRSVISAQILSVSTYFLFELLIHLQLTFYSSVQHRSLSYASSDGAENYFTQIFCLAYT